MVRTFSAGFLFCGLGAGARGFLDATAHFGGSSARFRSVGGVDVDRDACRDFERLTGSPALCADVHALQPAELRAAWGERRPDAVFLSPPCKGFSRLLSKAASEREEYQRLNRLVTRGLFVLCSAWDEPPPLLVLENVPGIQTRGAALLVEARQLLHAHGYHLHEQVHDCGEVGGLAQHRRRYLLVARRPEAVPAYVYRPPLQRVRGCGEVLGMLPLPEAPEAGPLHRLPRLSWINWLRLACIPAGGDWRDLGGVVPEGKKRHEVFARYDVRGWDQTARTVAGSGTNGGVAVADPRIAELHNSTISPPKEHPCRTSTPTQSTTSSDRSPPIPTIGISSGGEAELSTSSPKPAPPASARRRTTSGTKCSPSRTRSSARITSSAADQIPLGHAPRRGSYGVNGWEQPAATVVGAARVGGSNMPAAVVDPRLALGRTATGADTYAGRPGLFGVIGWDDAAPTVTGAAAVSSSNMPAAVADPRLTLDTGERRGGALGVMSWDAPSPTVTGESYPSNGSASVSDPRLALTCKAHGGAYGVMGWREPADTVTGSAQVDNGRAAVAAPCHAPPLPPGYVRLTLAEAMARIDAGEKRPPAGMVPVIASPHDGYWHRPLTTLELAALQGLPATLDGVPLTLSASSEPRRREHIGNAVPVGAAAAIGSSLLQALLAASLGTWTVGSTGIWVRERDAREAAIA